MLDDLLKILIDYGLDLPKDSRTLKETPRDINTSAKCSGKFIYLGLKRALHKYLEKIDCDEDNLKLAINVDGIPLFKSSSLWPILLSINQSSHVYLLLFCGNQKPGPIDDYLEEFLFDLVELRKDGHKFNVELHFVACMLHPELL